MKYPEKGQQFWMLNSRFEVIQTQNSGSEKSLKRIATGNCFETKEAAEEFKQYVLKGTTQIVHPKKIHVTDMSKEAVDTHYASLLLNNSMGHATEVIKYASMVIAAGPCQKNSQIRTIVNNFKEIHKQYSKRETELIASFEKVASDGR